LGREEDFGAYLVWQDDVQVAADFMKRLVSAGFETILVSPSDVDIPTGDNVEVGEPGREERDLEDMIPLQRRLVNHLREGERRAVLIFDLHALKADGGFHDLTGLIGRLYEEACVNRGLVLLFAGRHGFTSQELAFLERETAVIEGPDDLFPPTSETVK
jgi:hypothetical protein